MCYVMCNIAYHAMLAILGTKLFEFRIYVFTEGKIKETSKISEKVYDE